MQDGGSETGPPCARCMSGCTLPSYQPAERRPVQMSQNRVRARGRTVVGMGERACTNDHVGQVHRARTKTHTGTRKRDHSEDPRRDHRGDHAWLACRDHVVRQK